MQNPKMFIGGEWVDALSGKTFTTLNPSTGEEIGRVPLADAADVDRAVKAARAAFPAWSRKTQAERSKALVRVAALIREHAEELALMEGMEHGTPYRDAFGVAMGAADKFEYCAGTAPTLMGQHIPVKDGTLSYLQREPAGVVGFIIPWNLPTIMTAVKLAPALAVGNTCVLKPPSINSMIGLKFAEIFAQSALPPGAVNIITGPGGSAGTALVTHPGVDMIGFTGSSESGKRILADAAGTCKKCVMELGGNNPVIIMEDADLDASLKVLGWRQFNNSGQHCSGPGRYYVHEKVYDAFIEKYVAYAGAVAVGNPADRSVTMGPLVSREHQAKVEGYIRKGVEEGARLVFGADKPAALAGGFFVMPTILADCTHDMTVAREEIFGPVAVLLKYTDRDDIVALANDSPFGLCAHVWTGDIARGMKLVNDLHVGSVFINCQMLTNEQPWGTSIKESGIGKEGSLHGMAEFTDLKLVCINYDV
ncbi:MAG: aldehyde dehydrogenase [Acidobacteria bacterium]|nr:aldehyde dehydrogenase [Acidobacteriota bacterium]